MSFGIDRFQPNKIIAGKIIRLEDTGIWVDFSVSELAFIPRSKLSLSEIKAPEEAVKTNEIRDFLVVGNYDGISKIFFSHCSPETIINSDRLYKVVLNEASCEYDRPIFLSIERLLFPDKSFKYHQ